MKKIMSAIVKLCINHILFQVDLETRKKIELDTMHKKRGNFSNDLLISKLDNNKAFRNIFYWRIEKATVKPNKNILKVLKKIYPPVDTVEIYCEGDIGGGLYIPHNYCVINAKSIGCNVSILQGVTIGKDSKNKKPTIGNNVVVYPNAVIAGGIQIGDNVQIGANTFVNYNVTDNCTIKFQSR